MENERCDPCFYITDRSDILCDSDCIDSIQCSNDGNVDSEDDSDNEDGNGDGGRIQGVDVIIP